MCYKENERLVRRFEDIENDKRDLERRFIVVDTPIDSNSSRGSMARYNRC